jgi:hypothetical protein
VIGVRTVLQSCYSRETEAAADAYGRVQKIGAGPRALGAIACRAAGGPSALTAILLTHRQAREHAIAIDALAGAPAGEAANAAGLLIPAEWTGLNNICGATTHPAERKP